MLIHLANDESKPFSKDIAKRIAEATGGQVNPSKLQAEINRLAKREIVARNIYDDWAINEMALKTWIKEKQ